MSGKKKKKRRRGNAEILIVKINRKNGINDDCYKVFCQLNENGDPVLQNITENKQTELRNTPTPTHKKLLW